MYCNCEQNKTVDYKGLGNKIRKKRQLLGITQEQLAGETGLSITHISNIENGKVKVSLETLVAICSSIGESLDSLVLENVNCSNNLKTQGINLYLSQKDQKELCVINDVVKALADSIEKNY